MKQSFKSVTIEIFSVVFAVLFALGVNAWYDDYRDQKFADDALIKIVKEVKLNNEELKKQSLVLDTLTQNLNKYVDYLEGKIQASDIDLGYDYPSFYFTAWETAKITDVIRDMNYDNVLNINLVYENLKFYQTLVQQLVDHFLTKDFHDPKTRLAHIKAMRTVANNLASINQDAIKSHLELLDKIK